MPKTFKKMGDKPNSLWVTLKSRLSTLWRNTPVQRSFIRHPIDLFEGAKHSAKSNANSKHKKNATRHALGVTLNSRIVNGPELNILFLGVPFLISFGTFRATQKHAYKKKKKADAKAAQQRREENAIRLHLDNQRRAINKYTREMNEAVMTPLPHAPLAEEALQLYLAMVEAGMSQGGAYKFASGELEGEEISEVFSQEDCQVLIDSFGKYLVFENEDD